MTIIVWFKRDLRLHDHAALARAAEWSAESGAPVLPLYVVEPDYWRLPDASGRQWAFIADCLTELRNGLGALGAPLCLRRGDAVEVFEELRRRHGVTHVLSHEETGNLWTFARDRRVAAWARASGVVWIEEPQTGVVRRLADRRDWGRKRDAFMARAPLPAPAGLRGLSGLEAGPIPAQHDLALTDPCPRRQRGGRGSGLRLLASFLTERGEPYRTAMSSPLSGERACSRLSAHLAFGALSSREVLEALRARRAERPGGRWPGALSSFESRLAWRDYFMQRLESFPRVETHCLHRAAERLRPRQGDAAQLAAWSAGETGLPFVDACIRSLAATGWLNFRMRSMLMAVASYHLWLDWRQTGPVLARAFTDYEPGIHWPQVQMQSGVTGFNTPRIYNPVKQGLDQDPDGLFTRRWVPELRDVPDSFLQEPWKWPAAAQILGRAYPQPIIDVAESARFAREAIFGLRKTTAPAEVDAIATRHRPGMDPRLRADRPKASKRAAPDQMRFDL